MRLSVYRSQSGKLTRWQLDQSFGHARPFLNAARPQRSLVSLMPAGCLRFSARQGYDAGPDYVQLAGIRDPIEAEVSWTIRRSSPHSLCRHLIS